jgi:hypothetical protein
VYISSMNTNSLAISNSSSLPFCYVLFSIGPRGSVVVKALC